MKLNRKWLNEEFVDLSGVPDREFVETMTIAGQKVETYERLDAELRNVVVGRVVSITRHTNSDHMWVCQIDVGAGEPVQIVTGAQNVHEGDLVPVAQHNSWLPGGVHITKGKLRGEVSNGMLCSLKELGLTLNDFPYAIEDGIWILQEDCKPGDDINTVIGNDATVALLLLSPRFGFTLQVLLLAYIVKSEKLTSTPLVGYEFPVSLKFNFSTLPSALLTLVNAPVTGLKVSTGQSVSAGNEISPLLGSTV